MVTKHIIKDTSLTSLADMIREKLGVTDTFLPSEMAGKIGEVPGSDGVYAWKKMTKTTTTGTKTGTVTVSIKNRTGGTYSVSGGLSLDDITDDDFAGKSISYINSLSYKITFISAVHFEAYIDGSVLWEEGSCTINNGAITLIGQKGNSIEAGSGSFTVSKNITTTINTIEGYVTSDNLDEYPTDGSQHTDGYYYELVA